ncbi:MAG TPA: hypothetical protein VFS43_38000 [Polyangiaceae bacterium]|nr:hypothetical protein [Polyangiaceae bacterium]
MRRRALAGLWLAALLAAGAGSCVDEAEPARADCTPFERRFCRCADGVTQGSQACARDGRSYTECGPCADDDPSEPTPTATPACGNGRLERGEQCDDGNTDDGDQCPADCRRRAPTSGDGCGGFEAAPLSPGQEVESRQSLEGAADDARGSCGGEGPDVVFAFAPKAPGTLEVTMTPDGPALDAVLYVRRGACDDEGGQPAGGCRDAAGGGEGEALSVTVEAGAVYFVVADAQREAGAFTLRARLGPLPGGCRDEGDACATGLSGDCAPGTLRCEGGALACVPDRASEPEACGDGLDNDCDGEAEEGCACAHDKCAAGPPLDEACRGEDDRPDACVAAVCAADPYCCDATGDPPGGWDALCVAAVREVCGLLVCGEAAGACAHPVCEAGDPLDGGCDGPVGCVGRVCLADPFCCANAWDAQCVDRASSLCATAGDGACGG